MALERVAEHRLIGNALGPRVEACRQLLQRLFPPPWNETPAHRYQLGGAVSGWPHNPYRVRRCDVVVGLQISGRPPPGFGPALKFVPGVAPAKSPHHAFT